MILYDNEGNRIVAQKTTKPKFHRGGWDSVRICIDGQSYIMNCSVKGNRSNFYFLYNESWYRLPMTEEKIGDLYIDRPDLFTANIKVKE